MLSRLQGSRRTWILALAGSVLLGLLVYRLSRVPFEWRLFLTTLYRVDPLWLALSVLLMLGTYVGRALRWEVMLRPLGRTVSIRKLTYDTAIGFTAVVLLGRAGELVRPYLISVSADVPFSSQMAAWLLERILDLLAVLLLFGFGLTHLPSQRFAMSAGLRWILAAGGYLAVSIGAISLLFLILFRNFAEPVRARLLAALSFLPPRHFERAERTLDAFSSGMGATRHHGFLTRLGLYTALEWAIILGSYYTLFRAFPATSQFNITDVVIFLGFVAFGSIVQIPGIGGGIQVVSIIVLREIYGLPLEAAVGLAIFLWIVTVVVIVPIGLICATHEGVRWSKLKSLAGDVSI